MKIPHKRYHQILGTLETSRATQANMKVLVRQKVYNTRNSDPFQIQDYFIAQ